MECWIFTFPYKKYLWGHFYPIVINRQQKPTLKPFEPVRFTTGTIRKCYKLNLPAFQWLKSYTIHYLTYNTVTCTQHIFDHVKWFTMAIEPCHVEK